MPERTIIRKKEEEWKMKEMILRHKMKGGDAGV